MRAPTLIGLLVMLAALAAHADDGKDQAKRDVGAALAAQDAGRYDEAIALYRRAYEMVPHPEILFNLGQAYRLKGDAETALGYYRRYLAAEPDGRAAKDAQRWIAELGKRVADKREPARKADDARKAEPERAATAPKTKTEPERAAAAPKTKAERVANAPKTKSEAGRAGADAPKADARKVETGRTAASAPKADARKAETGRAVANPPRAGAPRSPESRAPDATRPDAGTVASAAPGPTGSSSVDTGAATGTAPIAPPPARDDSPSFPYARSAWIACIGGGSALIGGLVFGALAQSKLDAATAICGTDHRCDSAGDTKRANALLSESRSHGTISTVLVVFGAAGLVTGGVLWLGGRADSRQAVIAPIASPELVGLAVGGAF